jgi:uncharacterized protein (TIGR03435 family)
MRTAILGLALAAIAFAQAPAPDKSLTFEVASIKPAQLPTPDGQGRIMMRGPSGGPGTKDPGRISYPYMTLKQVMMIAYDVKNYQINGPQWLDSERFDITATMPPDTNKEQFHIMLQNLLIDRFKMAVHREKKELPMYSLVVNKGGPKMKESAPTTPAPDSDGPPPPPPPLPPGPPKIGPDGFPVLPNLNAGRPGMFMMMMPGRARLTASQQTMQDLANRLTGQLNRPVTDNTGLTAKYDFVLTYAPDPNEGPGRGGPGLGGLMVAVGRGPAPGAGAGPSPGSPDSTFIPEGETPQPLFGAVQSQLGLKLEPKKGDVEIVVIDKMEKTPTEN